MPRFGLPRFVVRNVELPAPVAVAVKGEERATEASLDADALRRLQRVEQRSDFHCVTTWTCTGLTWSGFRFRDVFEQLIAPACESAAAAKFARFRGADGFAAVLPLADALGHDVLLADRLEGRELGIEHGAPIRLVAPAHYAYKSVKHLVSIELSPEPLRGSAPLEELRARVADEERGRILPPRVLRHAYRLSVPWIVRLGRRASRRAHRAK